MTSEQAGTSQEQEASVDATTEAIALLERRVSFLEHQFTEHLKQSIELSNQCNKMADMLNQLLSITGED